MPDPRNDPGHDQRHTDAEATIAWAARLTRLTEIPGKPYEVHITLAGRPVPESEFYLGGVQIDGSTDYMIGVNVRQAVLKAELVSRAVTASDDEFEELCRRADEPPTPTELAPQPSQMLRDWRAALRDEYLKYEASPAAAALAREMKARYGPGAIAEELAKLFDDPAMLRSLGLDDPGQDPGQAA